MKKYIIQQSDTSSSLDRQFKLKNEDVLKTYHRLHCTSEDIKQESVPRKKFLITENSQVQDADELYYS